MYAALCLFCACGGKKSQEAGTHSVMLVKPVPIGEESLKTFSGIVEEAKEISLGFKVAGQVSRIYVKEGDFIRRGQPVATLDDKDYKLGVEALQIQYDQLVGEMERMKKLHAGKSLSDNDYEKALAGLQQVKVQLQTALNKLEYTRLQAPVDGYVQHVNFEPSEMVDAGTPVIALLDMNGMEVKVDIPVEAYKRKERFGNIFCQSLLNGGKEQAMKIVSIVPKADGTQLYRMRLAFSETPENGLTAGMNVEVGIHLSASSDQSTFTLPLHCIFQEQKENFVWTVDKDSVTHKTKVNLRGTDGSGQAIVTAGLKGDEQVVKAGVNALQDNEKVKVIDDASKTNVGGLL